MPEMRFTVRWPDGAVQDCYSPSLVMHDYLASGRRYTVDDFRDRSSAALSEASERVRAKFGFACTSAARSDQLITEAATRYDGGALVDVIGMQPPPESTGERSTP